MQNRSFRVASNLPRLAVDRRGSAGRFPHEQLAKLSRAVGQSDRERVMKCFPNQAQSFARFPPVSFSLVCSFFFFLNTPLKLKASLVPSTEEWMHAESFSLSFFFSISLRQWVCISGGRLVSQLSSVESRYSLWLPDCQLAKFPYLQTHTRTKCPSVPFLSRFAQVNPSAHPWWRQSKPQSKTEV